MLTDQKNVMIKMFYYQKYEYFINKMGSSFLINLPVYTCSYIVIIA